jgi:uncharacterized protein YcbK (DUF882 family)
MTENKNLSRRTFLGLAGAAVLTIGAAAWSVPAQATPLTTLPRRTLNFFNTHTNERIGGTYAVNGKYDGRVLNNFNYILRDHRSEEQASIDPKLFDQLSRLQALLQNHDTIEIISGYRSPSSNRMLASNSSGVARNSYHTRAQAIDIRIPSMPIGYVHRAAMSMRAGGVGYYPDSEFVHVDTGPVRAW